MDIRVFLSNIKVLISLLTVVGPSKGFPGFQSLIPNGDKVLHPCAPGLIWKGVGHINYMGAGALNRFGESFLALGKVWSITTCLDDTDGDGKKNGEELGDPDCVWRPGDIPTRTVNITNPGICDPWDSLQCSSVNYWVSKECKKVQGRQARKFKYTQTRPHVRTGNKAHVPKSFRVEKLPKTIHTSQPTNNIHITQTARHIVDKSRVQTSSQSRKSKRKLMPTKGYQGKPNCPGINGHGIRFSVNIAAQSVYISETSPFHCKVYDVPAGDYHLLAFKVSAENLEVRRSMAIFGCEGHLYDKKLKHSNGEVFPCSKMEASKFCRDIIAIWGEDRSSREAVCAHEKAAFLLGTSGYKQVVLRVYWPDVEKARVLNDIAEMNLFLSRDLRRQNAGVLRVGQEYLDIPPGETAVTVKGTCTSSCSKQQFIGPVQVIQAMGHMHALGKRNTIDVFRGGEKVESVITTNNYSYTDPSVVRYNTPITVYPGDELLARCTYDTQHQNYTTFNGQSLSEETCYTYITYFPKENIRKHQRTCAGIDSVPTCALEQHLPVDGCKWFEVLDLKGAEIKGTVDRVMKSCQPFGRCLKECKTLVQHLRMMPCFSGDIMYFLRRETTRINAKNRLTFMDFWAGMDSCYYDVALQKLPHAYKQNNVIITSPERQQQFQIKEVPTLTQLGIAAENIPTVIDVKRIGKITVTSQRKSSVKESDAALRAKYTDAMQILEKSTKPASNEGSLTEMPERGTTQTIRKGLLMEVRAKDSKPATHTEREKQVNERDIQSTVHTERVMQIRDRGTDRTVYSGNVRETGKGTKAMIPGGRVMQVRQKATKSTVPTELLTQLRKKGTKSTVPTGLLTQLRKKGTKSTVPTGLLPQLRKKGTKSTVPTGLLPQLRKKVTKSTVPTGLLPQLRKKGTKSTVPTGLLTQLRKKVTKSTVPTALLPQLRKKATKSTVPTGLLPQLRKKVTKSTVPTALLPQLRKKATKSIVPTGLLTQVRNKDSRGIVHTGRVTQVRENGTNGEVSIGNLRQLREKGTGRLITKDILTKASGMDRKTKINSGFVTHVRNTQPVTEVSERDTKSTMNRAMVVTGQLFNVSAYQPDTRGHFAQEKVTHGVQDNRTEGERPDTSIKITDTLEIKQQMVQSKPVGEYMHVPLSQKNGRDSSTWLFGNVRTGPKMSLSSPGKLADFRSDSKREVKHTPVVKQKSEQTKTKIPMTSRGVAAVHERSTVSEQSATGTKSAQAAQRSVSKDLKPKSTKVDNVMQQLPKVHSFMAKSTKVNSIKPPKVDRQMSKSTEVDRTMSVLYQVDGSLPVSSKGHNSMLKLPKLDITELKSPQVDSAILAKGDMSMTKSPKLNITVSKSLHVHTYMPNSAKIDSTIQTPSKLNGKMSKSTFNARHIAELSVKSAVSKSAVSIVDKSMPILTKRERPVPTLTKGESSVTAISKEESSVPTLAKSESSMPKSPKVDKPIWKPSDVESSMTTFPTANITVSKSTKIEPDTLKQRYTVAIPAVSQNNRRSRFDVSVINQIRSLPPPSKKFKQYLKSAMNTQNSVQPTNWTAVLSKWVKTEQKLYEKGKNDIYRYLGTSNMKNVSKVDKKADQKNSQPEGTVLHNKDSSDSEMFHSEIIPPGWKNDILTHRAAVGELPKIQLLSAETTSKRLNSVNNELRLPPPIVLPNDPLQWDQVLNWRDKRNSAKDNHV